MALIKAAGPGGMKFKTGVMVLYSDDESFTLMTPEGHMFAGWITFSSHEEDGGPVAQTQVLMRAQDPISEMGLDDGRPSAWRTSSGSRRSRTSPPTSASRRRR